MGERLIEKVEKADDGPKEGQKKLRQGTKREEDKKGEEGMERRERRNQKGLCLIYSNIIKCK